ncbi:4-hydroxythreonine-4-phosphate dehydrogenase PdxA [Urechidicola vernalis]|uniref:4-hydroxythreonine-4-phosphate dehydrogenase PdxA n=1 Tax=Urechidicola vernalis TaxID=3075600 RepID=A0ABU2Y4S0_9FLAO|nr:4-hydroxythreonine-4-phosphate dehydrogenase PdxA [Urechidicola sp. P050]MDT0553171.1 4-hydroxythreonine-4-phosphate dehydrogenase PdxA [Urechidicola sp. P050]
MEATDKIKVGISLGDINGIGIEVILKAFNDKRMLDFCTPILFGSSKVVAFYKKEVAPNIQIQVISDIKQVVDGKINVLNVWKEDVEVSPGHSNEIGGKYSFLSLKSAVKSLKEGFVDTLVTAPINKENIQSDDFHFAGHTEYLESELKGSSLMILMTDELKVGLVTGHIPVSEISSAITEDLITQKVKVLYNSLIQDFGIERPKIALLGLNPHCGDNGVIGKEDEEVIKPTVQKIQDGGKLVYGPYAADGFFGSKAYKNFDAVLAMYHDQGLAPFKSLSFGNGVNYTAGLDKVRTSPDHGTGFDISGKGMADESSFKEALFSAIEIHRNRVNFKELTQNVLKVSKRK